MNPLLPTEPVPALRVLAMLTVLAGRSSGGILAVTMERAVCDQIAAATTDPKDAALLACIVWRERTQLPGGKSHVSLVLPGGGIARVGRPPTLREWLESVYQVGLAVTTGYAEEECKALAMEAVSILPHADALYEKRQVDRL